MAADRKRGSRAIGYGLVVHNGGPGTGPYGGLSFNDVGILVQQLLMPVGAAPFHFVATGQAATFGPYAVPVGTTFEALSVDVTGATLGCLSRVLRYTTY